MEFYLQLAVSLFIASLILLIIFKTCSSTTHSSNKISISLSITKILIFRGKLFEHQEERKDCFNYWTNQIRKDLVIPKSTFKTAKVFKYL
jgi:hypothetical protein